jgi:hypothetical protein
VHTVALSDGDMDEAYAAAIATIVLGFGSDGLPASDQCIQALPSDLASQFAQQGASMRYSLRRLYCPVPTLPTNVSSGAAIEVAKTFEAIGMQLLGAETVGTLCGRPVGLLGICGRPGGLRA